MDAEIDVGDRLEAPRRAVDPSITQAPYFSDRLQLELAGSLFDRFGIARLPPFPLELNMALFVCSHGGGADGFFVEQFPLFPIPSPLQGKSISFTLPASALLFQFHGWPGISLDGFHDCL